MVKRREDRLIQINREPFPEEVMSTKNKHETWRQKRILETLLSGAHTPGEIAQKTGFTVFGVNYPLLKLMRQGFVGQKRYARGFRYHIQPERVEIFRQWLSKPHIAKLSVGVSKRTRGEFEEKIMTCLTEPRRSREIVSMTGLSPTSVQQYLRRLVKQRKIKRYKTLNERGREWTIYARPRANIKLDSADVHS